MCSTAAANSSTPPPAVRGTKKKRGTGPRANIGLAKAVDRGSAASEAKALLFPETPAALSGLPDLTKPFTVLGIETSCDDTGAAVVRSDGTILGEALASQQDIHEKWGGVVPGLAREAHVNEIDRIVAAALAQAGMASAAQVDAVAVTVGPGLEICLRVGCEKAKALALEHAKPFVAVHHLEAHVMLARAGLGAEEGLAPPAFPFLALLVSGGHCQLLLCEGVGRFSILGGTVDDALGEAFDKVARLLGLPTGGGGGPAVERCARAGDPRAYPLPIPMVHKKDMNFSYAGLKNSFRMTVERARAELALSADAPLPDGAVADLAASFQHAAITHLEQRVRRAVAHCHARGVRTLAVVGGVAANAQVRARLGALCAAAGERDGEGGGAWRMVVPPARLCTDNGVMVAWSAVERLRCGVSNAAAGQEVYARVPLGPQIAAEASGSGGGGSSPK